MNKIALRAASLFVAANGAALLWLAAYGALWRYTDNGWFQPYVLRPAMVLLGLSCLLGGTWAGLLSGTVAGDTLADAVDTRLARHVPRLWTWLHRWEIARGDWLPGDEEFSDARLHPPLPSNVRAQSFVFRAPRADNTATRVAMTLRAQAGRCAEAGLHDIAKELRAEADYIDGGVYPPRPHFHFNDDHYPGLVPTPMEGCDCERCEYLRSLVSPLSEDCESRYAHGSDPAFRYCKES